MREKIEELRAQAEEKDDNNTKHFAEKALDSLNEIDWRKQTRLPGIPCLVIEDNGRGMTGCENGPIVEKSDFDSFFFHMGQSNKTGTDGGSKGRGKSAFTCISDPRTIFVFTRTEKGTGFAGSTYLATRSIDRNNKILPYGYYIKFDGLPCAIHEEDNDPLYKLLEKKDLGTKIVILGFNAAKDKNPYAWKDYAAEAVLRNCGYLLVSGKLEVEIGNKNDGPGYHFISKDTLDDEINKLPKSMKNEAKSDIRNQMQNLRQTPVNFSILEENDTQLYLTISPDANSTIYYSRANGIKITSPKKKFGKPFSANVVCSGTQIDKTIRLGEDVTHTNLRTVNISDPKDIKAFDDAHKSLIDTITKYLIEVTNQDLSVPSEVIGLNNYLQNFRSVPIGDSVPTYKPVITIKTKNNKNGDKERGRGESFPGDLSNDPLSREIKTGTPGNGHSGNTGNAPTFAFFPIGNIPYDSKGNKNVKKLQIDLAGKVSVTASNIPGVYHVTIYPTDYDISDEYIYFQLVSETDNRPNSDKLYFKSFDILDVFNVNGVPFTDAAYFKANITKIAADGINVQRFPRSVYGPIVKPAANIVSFDVKLENSRGRTVYLCLTDINNTDYYEKVG